jgi:hypothetical protein
MSKPKNKKEALTAEQKKIWFMEGVLNATNLPEDSRLNILGSLEGTVKEARLMKMAVSNKAIAIARAGGQEKGKLKEASLIELYEKNTYLHTIKSSSKVAREIIKLVSEDRRVAEKRFGKERTIAEKIREHRKSKK